MQKYYEKSLKVIQQQGIKNEKDYNKVAKTYVILSSESLKYISCTSQLDFLFFLIFLLIV